MELFLSIFFWVELRGLWCGTEGFEELRGFWYGTEGCVELRGFRCENEGCVDLRGFRCGTEGGVELRGGWTEGFLVFNWGISGAEKERPFCVELMCWTEGDPNLSGKFLRLDYFKIADFCLYFPNFDPWIYFHEKIGKIFSWCLGHKLIRLLTKMKMFLRISLKLLNFYDFVY